MSKKSKLETPLEIESLANFPQVTAPSRVYQSKIKEGSQSRIGKGFSLKEIKAAAIPLDLIKNFSPKITIDRRRRSLHDENVAYLGRIFREILSNREEDLLTLKKIDKKKKELVKGLTKGLGISKNEGKTLVEAGVKSLKQLAEEDAKTLAKDLGIKVAVVNKWKKEAKRAIITEQLNASVKNISFTLRKICP